MKKLFFLVVALILSGQISAQIDVSKLDSLINDTKKKNKEINSQIRSKALYDDTGYLSGDKSEFSDWWVVFYFDAEGTLKKSSIFFSHFEGSYIHYYSNNVIISEFFSSYTGMHDASYSFLKYLNEDGELIKLDCIRIDVERNNQLMEHIVRKGGYENLNLCDVKIHSVSEIESFFDIEKVHKPKKTIPVKLVKPGRGDTTIINDNSINLRKDASTVYSPIMQLNVGDKVHVLDVEGQWYKVKYTTKTYVVEEVIGYVYQDFLEPVEKIVEE